MNSEGSKKGWCAWDEHPGDWDNLKVTFGRYLTDEEVLKAAGCIGYALCQVLHGERLSAPLKIKRTKDGKTVVRFFYDSTKSASDDPDFGTALFYAACYVADGRPVRTTNRAGAGTKGTRLCEGIGPCPVTILVR